MGYTHYWSLEKDFSDTEWDALCRSAAAIFEAAKKQGIDLWAEYDNQSPPVIENKPRPQAHPNAIIFNGAEDEGHETMVLNELRTEFNFCKTARKPYDVAVVALLIEADRISPNFDWSSDGQGEPDYDLEARELLNSLPIANYEDKHG